MENVFCSLFNCESLEMIADWVAKHPHCTKINTYSFDFWVNKPDNHYGRKPPLSVRLSNTYALDDSTPAYQADILISYIPYGLDQKDCWNTVLYRSTIIDDRFSFSEKFKRSFEMLYKPIADGKPEKYEALVENLRNLAALNNLD